MIGLMMAGDEKPELEETPPAAPETAEDGALSALKAENADLKDKLLRALAEVENIRRRAERDKEDTAKYAVSSFARDLLNVADNLRRALDSLPEEARADATLNAFLSGVEITEKDLLAALEKQGIKAVNPAGQKFDHNFHQAMFEVETADQEPGTVVQVVQTGYVIKDRLLRPAMVGVAKAPAAKPGHSVDTSA
jgi:molecular chaperone GrpE